MPKGRVGMHQEKNLKVLCFEHHTEMRRSQALLKIDAKVEELPAYVCEEPDCFVRYSADHGYFVANLEGDRIEGELTPHVVCPEDGRFLYLAEVRPEQKSYRLWKCPQCGKGLNNEGLTQASSA
jgi:hypothetical protein